MSVPKITTSATAVTVASSCSSSGSVTPAAPATAAAPQIEKPHAMSRASCLGTRSNRPSARVPSRPPATTQTMTPSIGAPSATISPSTQLQAEEHDAHAQQLLRRELDSCGRRAGQDARVRGDDTQHDRDDHRAHTRECDTERVGSSGRSEADRKAGPDRPRPAANRAAPVRAEPLLALSVRVRGVACVRAAVPGKGGACVRCMLSCSSAGRGGGRSRSRAGPQGSLVAQSKRGWEAPVEREPDLAALRALTLVAETWSISLPAPFSE